MKNTFNPTFRGTLVTNREETAPNTVKAVTAIRDVSMVTVAGRGMIGVPGIAARTFSAVAKQNANILMIAQSSSEQSICFVVPQSKSQAVIHAIQAEFAIEFGRQDIERAWPMTTSRSCQWSARGCSNNRASPRVFSGRWATET